MTGNSDDIRNRVREGYSEIARTGQWSGVSANPANTESGCCAGGGCCGPTTMTPDQIAGAVGYAASDLQNLPAGANMGLSCGNPTALASLNSIILLGSDLNGLPRGFNVFSII